VRSGRRCERPAVVEGQRRCPGQVAVAGQRPPRPRRLERAPRWEPLGGVTRRERVCGARAGRQAGRRRRGGRQLQSRLRPGPGAAGLDWCSSVKERLETMRTFWVRERHKRWLYLWGNVGPEDYFNRNRCRAPDVPSNFMRSVSDERVRETHRGKGREQRRSDAEPGGSEVSGWELGEKEEKRCEA
jgi:hypothetical protein